MTTVLLFAAASFAMIIAVLTWLKATKVESFYPQKPVSKFKIRSNRAVWLSQARVNMTPEEFWLITLLCGSAVFLLVLLFSKTPLVALAIGAGSAGIPYSFIAKKRTHTSKELINAWPEALRDISSTISAGHSLSFSLHTLAKVGPDPISPHMARFQILERSVGFATALEIVREEMCDATTDRILEVLIVAHERGGKVVKEIIDDLIEATTQDIALADAIATESIEMKINSKAVVIIPWVVLFLLTLSGGIFREFYQSASGAIVIFTGACLSALGMFILSRLNRTDIEKRVFRSVEELKA